MYLNSIYVRNKSATNCGARGYFLLVKYRKRKEVSD